MKLPYGENAIVDLGKLTAYCLSSTHAKGKHKALVFESVLGITHNDAEFLQSLLKAVAIEGEASQGSSDLYGTRYIIDFELSWNLRTATVRSCWIVDAGTTVSRFVTCYIL